MSHPIIRFLDRSKETTTTTGSGLIALGGAVAGFVPISGIGSGNCTYYTLEEGSSFEVGIGKYDSAANTLSRDEVFSSSNSDDSKINLGGGASVFITYPSDKAIAKTSGNFVGIGIDPEYQLQVSGTGSFNTVRWADGTTQITSAVAAIATLTTNLESTGQTNASKITTNTSSIATAWLDINQNISNIAATGQTNANAITVLQTGGGGGTTYTAGTGLALVGTRFDTAGTGYFYKLGIGTASPTYELDVAGNAGFNEYIYHNGDADTFIRLRDNNINLVAGSWSAIKLEKSTGKIQLNNSNQDLDVQITALGGDVLLHTDAETKKVGIGTVTPGYTLEVSGTGSFSTVRWADGTTQTTSATAAVAATGQTNANGITTLTTNLASTGQTNANVTTANAANILIVSGLIGGGGGTGCCADNAADIVILSGLIASTGQTNANVTTANASSISTLTTNLASTGQTNANGITTLTTNLASTGQTNANVITANASSISTLTTNLASTGQTNANGITTLTTNLASTGQTNANVITANASSISTLTTNLASTGQTNANGITTLTTNLASTGQTNANVITANASSISTLTTNLASTGQTNANVTTANAANILIVSGLIGGGGGTGCCADNAADIVILSGLIASTGQTNANVTTANASSISTLTTNLASTGQTNANGITTLTTNLASTGQTNANVTTANAASISTLTTNLASTGQTNANVTTANAASISTLTTNLASTGQTNANAITSLQAGTNFTAGTGLALVGKEFNTTGVGYFDILGIGLGDLPKNPGGQGVHLAIECGGVGHLVGLRIKAYGGAFGGYQTENLTEWRSSGNSLLAYIDEGGSGTFAGLRFGDGTIQTTSATGDINTLTNNLASTGQTNANVTTANASSISTLTTNLASTGQTNANGITTLTTNLASTGQTNANVTTANAASISTLTTNLASTGQTNANVTTANAASISTLTTNLASTGQTNANVTTANAASISTLTTNLASTGQTNANAITSLQPGGSNTQIQFNDSSSYGGDSDLTWNKTTNILTVNGTGVFDRIGVNDSTPDAMLDITCSSASTKGLIVEGAVGQSENLIEGGNLAHAAPLFKVSADGAVTCKSVALTGTNLVLGRPAISPTIKVADGGNNLNIRNFNASKDINVDIAESGNFFQIRTKDGGTTTTRVQWEDTGKRRDKAASYADIKNNGDAGTITFDLDVANVHQVTLVANRIFALSNPSSGQRFMVRVLQDGTGGRSGVWWNGIKWAGGIAQPTQGESANKASLYGFLCIDSGNTYDGFVIGTGII